MRQAYLMIQEGHALDDIIEPGGPSSSITSKSDAASPSTPQSTGEESDLDDDDYFGGSMLRCPGRGPRVAARSPADPPSGDHPVLPPGHGVLPVLSTHRGRGCSSAHPARIVRSPPPRPRRNDDARPPPHRRHAG